MKMLTDQILKNVEKPGRYIGGEFGQVIKDKSEINCRFAFCFPDTYEIGMSNLGIRILYGVLNGAPDVWCERSYAPWPDMEAQLRENRLPLYAHESKDPLTAFDFVGFTLQYELCYSNVVNMLDLAGIPLLSAQRTEQDPLVIGGGPCTYNPEPVADFFDLFSIGEGEESLLEITRLYIDMKKSGRYSRKAFLRAAAQIPGTYVPSLYDVQYNSDGTIQSITPTVPEAPARVTKRIIQDLDKAYYPDRFVMPYIQTVHDRVMLEVYRGCIRGCRFCQAGMVYRPVREKTPDCLNEQAKRLCGNTGYDEISLSSLSISDYSCINELTEQLLAWTDEQKINLSFPSLRLDTFTKELMDKISSVRASGLTFAPEAGTQRLRDVINKNITEEDLMKACDVAFGYGRTNVKLYFMNGLPTETNEDIEGIADLAEKVVRRYYESPARVKGRAPSVTVSVSCFVPKACTPFQWEPQDTLENLREKQMHLAAVLKDRKKIRYNWHEAKVSVLEGVFARGDRRLSAALLQAHRLGIRFDGWDEHFNFDLWQQAFAAAGIDPAFYAHRRRDLDEVLPWDVIDCGVTKAFLKREWAAAKAGVPSPNCKQQCLGCGANQLGGERTWCTKTCGSSLKKETN